MLREYWKSFQMVTDLVCGMEIDEKNTKWKSEYKGNIHYFCGPMCKLEFDENPEKYISEARDVLDK
jgi:YHS domain-containing protein